MRINYKTAFGYAYVHFAMEVMCFFFLYTVFGHAGSYIWWMMAMVYDCLAFALQPAAGTISERFPRFSPGLFGGALIIAGAAMGLAAYHPLLSVLRTATASGATAEQGLYEAFFRGLHTGMTAPGRSIFLFGAVILGLVILSVGNAFLHIAGALATLRASEGRMSESGIFVGAGAFGVITGRMLAGAVDTAGESAGAAAGTVLPFLLMAAALVTVWLLEKGSSRASFDEEPCLHDTAGERPAWVVITVLAAIVAVRSYISNGIPMDWNKTKVQLVMLFIVMGAGKMAGGVLADLFGARLVGTLTCILAIPFLLAGADIMWLSLIGIALFSMTMAIALAGIVSVMRRTPGTAFGITTLALFLGTLPVAFFGVPGRGACVALIIIMSLASAAGMIYTLKDRSRAGR
ncbi:MAG: hypothetical protein K6G81_06620 [Lachnospiraceae bacterium]|nr:hypothetical protein [Lachnospiraceae bacterium]